VDDREGRSVGDGQRRVRHGGRESDAGEACLLLAESRQGRFHGALEPFLDDELGLAVAEQDQDGVEAGRN
jgi:hypothetical protein